MTGYAEAEPVSRDQPHHYIIHVEYCPVCGKERTERTRKPGPRIKTDNEAADFYNYYILEERYDYCQE